MLDSLRESLEVLNSSYAFREYIDMNSSAYLTAGFIVIDVGENAWQLDYYNPDKHKITTFVVDDNVIKKPEDDIFQKQDKKLDKLELSKVKVNFDTAREMVANLRSEKYIDHNFTKTICIIQPFNKLMIWNVTCLSDSMNVLNIKINANDGAIIEEKLTNIMSYNAS